MSTFSSNRQFSLALEALSELQSELEAQRAQLEIGDHLTPVPLAPSLDSVLDEMGPMPREALFLGIASDGLPVLLNLYDPSPGPLLVAGDPGAGKTAFLQNIAHGVHQMHEPEDVQFGVMTAFPDEWEGFSDLPHSAGVFPFYRSSAIDFLYSLSGWAHANKGSRQAVVLLLDDLENMEQVDFEARQTLRWLLLRGPARQVWPLITINAERASQVEAWLEAFRTRVFGQIGTSHPCLFEKDDESIFRSLKAGVQFALREGRNWLKFWVPAS
jgi:hypothetical protein